MKNKQQSIHNFVVMVMIIIAMVDNCQNLATGFVSLTANICPSIFWLYLFCYTKNVTFTDCIFLSKLSPIQKLRKQPICLSLMCTGNLPFGRGSRVESN